jgi:hypothetical protein
MVTMLMVYASGVEKMLETAMESIRRHDSGTRLGIKIVLDNRDKKAFEEVSRWSSYDVEIVGYDVGVAKSGSGQHGRLLDRAIQDVTTEYTLTMDSDCFPVADDWVGGLLRMMENKNVAASGIRWPWCPIESDVDQKSLEWRIRQFHNWENLQVACQLVRTKQMLEMGWKFADPYGDDTNHGFMKRLKEAGFEIDGWHPTRGPLSDDGLFDSELNRHESIIYGERIYHHVGATRECRDNVGSCLFQKARQKVYNEKGAEWMLKCGNSHFFEKTKEEEVSRFKMKQMYSAMIPFLEKHGCLFSNDWA